MRSVRGLSFAELGRVSGLAGTVISKFESGIALPVAQEEEALAAALRVSVSFLNGPDVPVYRNGQASFRARSTLSLQTIDAALAMMSLAQLVSEWFDKTVLDVPVELPDLRGETPEHAAEMVRAEWGLGAKGVNNVIHLIETKGVRVFPVDQMAPNMDAFCGWMGHRPAVFLRRGTTGARCRFDACHELGHLLLHRGRDWTRGDAQIEAEADAFAAAFLMPRPAVVALVSPRVSIMDLVTLKANWKVSVMALNRRLRDVGVFGDRRYVENVKEASRRGWRSSEPDDVPFESSLVWNKAVDHVGRSGSSIEKVASEIGLDASDVERMLTSFVTTSASHLSIGQGKSCGRIGWAREAKIIVNPILADVKYAGRDGITQACRQAMQRIVESQGAPDEAVVVSSGSSRAFLLVGGGLDTDTVIMPGFGNGYTGEGPDGFEWAKAYLVEHGASLREVEVDERLMARLRKRGLDVTDVELIHGTRAR